MDRDWPTISKIRIPAATFKPLDDVDKWYGMGGASDAAHCIRYVPRFRWGVLRLWFLYHFRRKRFDAIIDSELKDVTQAMNDLYNKMMDLMVRNMRKED